MTNTMKGSNFISICKGRYWNSYVLSSNKELLQTDTVIIKITHESLEIKRPTLNYLGKTHTVSNSYTRKDKGLTNWKGVTISDSRLKVGKYEINEEWSDEDTITIFF